MNYKVGQVLYLCNEENMKIIPIQIIEEITRTTIEGKEKNYIATFPDRKKTKINISSIQEQLFSDIKQIKNHMIQNATNAIIRMSNAAQELEKIAFDLNPENVKEKENHVNLNESYVQAGNKDDIITVDLGDGTKAKMKTSNLEKVKI